MHNINLRAIKRISSRWLFAASVLSLLATLGATAAENDFRDPRQYFFQQSFGDWPEELKTARESRKQGILLFFEADGCRYCAAMMKQVLSHKNVQDWYGGRFTSIAVDIHGDVEITDLDGITLPEKVVAEHRRVFLTPTLSFIDLDGVEVYRHTGMVKTPEELLVMGEYIVGKHYFDTEYAVYAKMQGLELPGNELVTPVQ